jgi:ABC-type multidrug transport system permease subunit
MNNKDFMTCFWGFPFLGAFLAFVLAVMFQAGEAIGIMVMLGIVAGYLALLTYILGMKFISTEEKKDENL